MIKVPQYKPYMGLLMGLKGVTKCFKTCFQVKKGGRDEDDFGDFESNLGCWPKCKIYRGAKCREGSKDQRLGEFSSLMERE